MSKSCCLAGMLESDASKTICTQSSMSPVPMFVCLMDPLGKPDERGDSREDCLMSVGLVFWERSIQMDRSACNNETVMWSMFSRDWGWMTVLRHDSCTIVCPANKGGGIYWERRLHSRLDVIRWICNPCGQSGKRCPGFMSRFVAVSGVYELGVCGIYIHAISHGTIMFEFTGELKSHSLEKSVLTG